MLRARAGRHVLVSSLLLAIGAGAGVSMLAVLNALSTSGLPYPHADRLVVLRVGGPSWSPAMLEAVSTSTTLFDAMAGVQERAATLLGADAAEVVRLESVSAAYFDLLGAPVQVGRWFTKDEDRRGGTTAVALVSDGLWRRRFGADPAAVGQRLEVDGRSLEIVGVLPRHFRGLIGRTDIWTPLGSARWLSGDTGPERPTSRWFEVLARRQAAVTHDAAAARFATEARDLILKLPAGDRIVGPTTRLTVVPLATARVPAVFPRAARVLAIAVAAVLVLVVVSIASLNMVRLEERRRELAIRLSLGASMRQLARLAAGEAVVMTVLGTAGALLVRPYFLAALSGIEPPSTVFGIVSSRTLTSRALELDALTVLAAIGIAIAGSLPLAIGLLRSARRLDIERVLRGNAPVDLAVHGRRNVRWVLVTLQSVLACVVVGGAALLARGADTLIERDRGYNLDGVTTARVDLPERYAGPAAAVFYEELVRRLNASPGVASSSVSSCAPGGGRCRLSNVNVVDGRPLDHGAHLTVGVNYVTPDHFATIGARLDQGRPIMDADGAGAPLAVIVSSRLAAALWPNASPLGRSLEIYTATGSLNGSRTVIGTLKPIDYALESDPGLDVFLPAAQAAWPSGVIFVKGRQSSQDLGRLVSATVTSIDRAVPVREVGSLEATLRRSLSTELFLRNALIAFGLTGVLLAALGTYAVVAQSVAASRRELGLRIALGASTREIHTLVARRGLLVAAIAAAAGIAGQTWTAGVLASLLHGLPPTDAIAMAAGPVLTVFAIVVAISGPALRASRTNPIVALRTDP
jgi:predicted permease